MWLFLYSGKQFEETFENTQWRKVKNAINATLPVLIQVIWVNMWNHTLGKNQINATNVTLDLFVQTKIQSMRLCLYCLSKHLKSHIGEKSNKCNDCDFTSIRANKNAINATLPVLIQDIWENIWNHTVEKVK